MRLRSTSSALLFALALTTAGKAADARPEDPTASSKDGGSVDPKAREKSRAAFRRGVAQLRAQDWAGARASFEEAWSLVEHPSILLNLGIARLHTDDPVLAEQDLLRFLTEDLGAAPEELASARDALTEARSRVATLRIIATPATARVVVDGKPIDVRALQTGDGQQGVAEARLKVGPHSVLVEADGFDASTKPVDLGPKTDTELRIALAAKNVAEAPPATPSSRTRRIVGWSLAGTAGAALIASGAMALRAVSLAGDYEDRGSPSFQKVDVRDEGVAFRTGADVALALGLVAGAGAVVLLFTDVGAPHRGGVARLAHPFTVAW